MLRKALLSGAALLSATSAQAEWLEASSKHFVVYADDSLADVRGFTEKLERFDKAIRVWHVAKEDVRGPSARVTVYLVNSTSDIARLYGDGGSNVAGFYKPIAGQSVAFVPREGTGDLSAQAVLLHEYTHHWMLTNWTDAALPPWFVEGFAELHATALFRNNAVIFGSNPSYRKYTIGNMNALPTERLLRFDPGRLGPVERDALYSRGWALTHYLTFDPEGRKRLAAYIGQLNGGKAGDARALLAGEGNLDLKINSYVRRPQLASAALPYAQLPIEPVQVRTLSAGEAAMMPTRMLSKRGVDKASAGRVLTAARAAAAPYANDPAVQVTLAEAEYDACNEDPAAPATCFGQAEAAADRALAVQPKSVPALIYKGMAQVGALRRGKVADPARWQAARASFLSANRADPESPEPLIAFYQSFVAAGQKPTANADTGLLYAYALAPYDAGLRMRATNVLVRQGKFDEARVALAPIAYNVEAPGRAERAQKVLAAIDAKDQAGALAAMRAPAKSKDEEGEDDDSDG
jgi:hypothetical protein